MVVMCVLVRQAQSLSHAGFKKGFFCVSVVPYRVLIGFNRASAVSAGLVKVGENL